MDPFESLVSEFAGKAGLALQSGKDGSVDLVVDGVDVSVQYRPDRDDADVIVSGALKGAGDTHFVMTWILVTAFLFWLPLVFAVRHWHNTMPALWGTMVVYVVVICIGSFIRWRRGSWAGRLTKGNAAE